MIRRDNCYLFTSVRRVLWVLDVIRFDMHLVESVVNVLLAIVRLFLANECGSTGCAIRADGEMKVAFDSLRNRGGFLRMEVEQWIVRNGEEKRLTPSSS